MFTREKRDEMRHSTLEQIRALWALQRGEAFRNLQSDKSSIVVSKEVLFHEMVISIPIQYDSTIGYEHSNDNFTFEEIVNTHSESINNNGDELEDEANAHTQHEQIEEDEVRATTIEQTCQVWCCMIAIIRTIGLKFKQFLQVILVCKSTAMDWPILLLHQMNWLRVTHSVKWTLIHPSTLVKLPHALMMVKPECLTNQTRKMHQSFWALILFVWWCIHIETKGHTDVL